MITFPYWGGGGGRGLSHCTIHSFEIICRGWKVGLADHMMRTAASIIASAIRYNVTYKYILTASGSRLFGSVVRSLDFYPGDPGSNPVRYA